MKVGWHRASSLVRGHEYLHLVRGCPVRAGLWVYSRRPPKPESAAMDRDRGGRRPKWWDRLLLIQRCGIHPGPADTCARAVSHAEHGGSRSRESITGDVQQTAIQVDREPPCS